MNAKIVGTWNSIFEYAHWFGQGSFLKLGPAKSAFLYVFGVASCAFIVGVFPVAANAQTPIPIRQFNSLGNVDGTVDACPSNPPLLGESKTRLCHILPLSNPGPFSITETDELFYDNKYWDVIETYTGTYFVNQNLDLKYQIASVVYSVPGQQSYVDYTNGSMLGTSTTNSATWSASVSENDNVSAGGSLFGIVELGAGGGASFGLTQTQTTSSTITLQETETTSIKYPGPLSSAAGLDHDYDCTVLWFDPVSDLYAASATDIMWKGYSNNPSDPANGVDSACLYEMWLENPSLISVQAPGDEMLVERTWDNTGLGGLTSSDYAQILNADPFSENSAYNPNVTSRFTYLGYIMQYQPAPDGGQPPTDTQTIQVQTNSSATNSSEISYTVGFTTQFSGAFLVKNSFSASAKYTTTDGWSSTVNNGTTYDATVSLTGPTYSADYTGPVEFQVWRDNVYGTLMLYPVNE